MEYFAYTSTSKNAAVKNVRMSIWTERLITSRFYNERLRGYRNVAQSYISNKEVRKYFIDKVGNKCELCGKEEKLELHHKVSVSTYAYHQLPIETLNEENNIQVLCKKCHSILKKEVQL